MTDIGPEAEIKPLGDDFAVAKRDDSRLRYALLQLFQHHPSCHSRTNLDGIFHNPAGGCPVMSNVREPLIHPIPILSLRPTQMTGGMRVGKEKRKRFREKKKQ